MLVYICIFNDGLVVYILRGEIKPKQDLKGVYFIRHIFFKFQK